MVIVDKKYKIIGTAPVRHDGVDKVTGRAIYGADIKLPGMLFGAVVRSPHAHAVIKNINVEKALKSKGVKSVVTASDFPEMENIMDDMGDGYINKKFVADKICAGVNSKALYKGHPIAAVCAETRQLAEEAVSLIEVEFEPLQAITSVDQAIKSTNNLLHRDFEVDHYGTISKGSNVASKKVFKKGDVATTLENSKYKASGFYRLQTVHQGYIEPQVATALWDEADKVKIWTSTQGSFPVRKGVSKLLKLSESNVEVTPLEIGGGFGGKIDVYLEPLAAMLSKKSGHKPVKMVMSREEVFEATGPSPGGTVEIESGADEEGKLTAVKATVALEAGAFPGSAVIASALCIIAPYNLQTYEIHAWDVLVNKPKSAAYRAPGAPHAHFAMESVVDDLCVQAGWDKIQFRLNNASEKGTRDVRGIPFMRIGNKEVLSALRKSEHWNSPKGRPGEAYKKRGRGIANGYWFNGGNRSVVSLALNEDGIVNLTEGSTDIGGTRTSIAMQAAEILQLPVEKVIPTVVGTTAIGYTDVTGGSRTTYATGYAAHDAAVKLVEELKKRVAILYDAQNEDISYSDSIFYVNSQKRLDFDELCKNIDETGGPVVAIASVNLPSGSGAFCAHLVDLDVDTETGKVDIVRYSVVLDAGKAIYPPYVEGQIHGGVAQGVGWALNEEYYMSDDGKMLNASFLDYRMPTSLDLPNIETDIVEVPSELHPYGVRGVGEAPICAPLAAVHNAIYDAIGVRIYETPMKPSLIFSTLHNKD